MEGKQGQVPLLYTVVMVYFVAFLQRITNYRNRLFEWRVKGSKQGICIYQVCCAVTCAHFSGGVFFNKVSS